MESINESENGIFQCPHYGIRLLDGGVPKPSRKHGKGLIGDFEVCDADAEPFGIVLLTSLW